MQRLFTSQAAANSVKKNQLSFTYEACRAFSAGPKPNPFDSVKTNLGNKAFYKLPSLNDDRLGKYIFIFNIASYELFGTKIFHILVRSKLLVSNLKKNTPFWI